MENANRHTDSDNGYGNPKPGAAGFSYPSRRPLISRTFMQVAFFQALFGDEPLRSYCAQFIPPHLLSNNGSSESARANEGQNYHSSQLASDSSRPDGYEHKDVEVTNEEEVSGEPNEVRKEEVSIHPGQEYMKEVESTNTCDANMCLDKSDMIVIGDSGRMGVTESGNQVVADGGGCGNVSAGTLSCREQLSNIEKVLMDELPGLGQFPIDNGDGSITTLEAINSFLDMDLLGKASSHDGGPVSHLKGVTAGQQGGEKEDNELLKTSNSQSRRSPSPILYTRDQLLKLRQVTASISGDILKIKQEFQAELHGGHHNQADNQSKDVDVSKKTRSATKKQKGRKKDGVVSSESKNGVALVQEKVDKAEAVITEKGDIKAVVEDNGKSEKEAADTSHKRKKRGSVSKEKKKQKERKRRAAKNRELGVKRLKIQPILKPKKVSICRHYLMGRCHEGEKCKFSHDGIPLTKSKPCCHFARQACMKGENCPFDHELSKYPCNNYVTDGFCCRGDSCLFSHKILSKEGSEPTVDVSKIELKSLDPPNKPITRQHVNYGGLFSQKIPAKDGLEPAIGASKSAFKSSPSPNKLISGQQASLGTCNLSGVNTANFTKDNVVLCKPGSQTPAPKGLNFISFGKSTDNASTMNRPAHSFVKSGNDSQTSNQLTHGTEQGLQTVLPPRGISFLSFGKTSPPDVGDGKKPSLLPEAENRYSVHDKKDGDKRLPSDIILNGLTDVPRGSTCHLSATSSSIAGHARKQDTFSTQREKSFDSSFHDNGSSNKHHLSNAMPRGIQDHTFSPVVGLKKFEDAPRGFSFLSVGKTSSIHDPNGKRARLPTNIEKDGSSVTNEQRSAERQPSNLQQPDHPFSPGVRPKKSEDALARGTLTSTPRSLLSTLAFAAKYESVIRNSSAGSSSSSSEPNKSTGADNPGGNAKNEPMKPTAIHELLYGGKSGTK